MKKKYYKCSKLVLIIIVFLFLLTIFPSAICKMNCDTVKPVSVNEVNVDNRGNIIVFTANQEWLSRIYLLNMDGSVIRFFEYEFYRFVDLEVVNNEVYVAEAFAPRVYKVDLETGDLELIIDDWTMYYFYGLVFDGTYFYVDEWDLNRYDINGVKDGMASFDETVYGSAWDGSYIWMLGDENWIKCWNVSSWPTLDRVTENEFAPPSPNCRGLWFDGEFFWTAESLDGQLGYIYQFDYAGKIVNQWLEPAFSGWSACTISKIICGDANDDGEVNVGDAVYLINFVFNGGPEPTPFCSGDANGDGEVNIGDSVYLINYVFKGGPAPVQNCCD